MYVEKELKILLLMPYFERPKMVLNALRSIQKINYANYEVCIIDDGSVKNPIENVIKENKLELKNTKILNTKDTIQNKLLRGSIHGKYMNAAIKDSDADIVVMMSDDDALVEEYFKNLNIFYSQEKNCMYSYCHVIPFDPMSQVPCKTLLSYNLNKSWNTAATTGLNWVEPINPFCKIDATQVSWRRDCNIKNNIWFPEEQTKNLDASFFEKMFENFGYCVFNNCYGIYKGFHEGQLSNASNEKQYDPIDCDKNPNYFSICSNFKNEAKYLKEWLEYHINIGVDHFYLYDHDSTDNYKEILKPFFDKGYITLKKVNTNNVKKEVYEDFMKNYKFKTFWTAFIDCDEFITIKEKNIFNFMINYEEYCGLGINWLMFGSSGHLKYVDGVLNNYDRCNNPYDFTYNNVSCHIKTICNPRKAENIYINPHYPIYNSLLSFPKPALNIDENFEYITGNNVKNTGENYYFAATDFPKFKKIFIRHYWSKSKEEFIERRASSIRDDNSEKRYINMEECLNDFEFYDKLYNVLEYKKFMEES